MRIGLNSGPAVVGDVGSPEQSNHTVIGDTVNVASRLESSLARPGEVVIGPRTHEMIRDLCDVVALDPVELKNRREPIRPYRVIGERGAPLAPAITRPTAAPPVASKAGEGGDDRTTE